MTKYLLAALLALPAVAHGSPQFNGSQISTDTTLNVKGLNISAGGSINVPQGSLTVNGMELADSAWQSRMFTNSGSFTVPAQSSMVFVTLCGGGGGGGGTNNSSNQGGGGGGNSGVVVRKYPIYISHNASVSITIGASGSGGSAGNNGTAGNNTSITYTDLLGNSKTIYAVGGGGGRSGNTADSSGSGENVGICLSSAVAGSNSTVQQSGRSNGYTCGTSEFFVGFGGGGGRTNTTNIGGYGASSPFGGTGVDNAGYPGGSGGSSPWGLGGQGGGGSSTNGGPGTGYCSGGGGGNNQNQTTSGGSGSGGLVVFEWVGIP